MVLVPKTGPTFRDPGAAQAGGYVLALAGVVIAIGLTFHPLPAGGFEEKRSVLQNTPWWGFIHAMITVGFVLTALGSLLVLVSGGTAPVTWMSALCWGAMTVGMIFFTGTALITGWVMHALATQASDPSVYDAFNRLLIGFGWLGNPLFLVGFTGITVLEVQRAPMRLPGWLAFLGLVLALLSWGRGMGSATGLYFLEPLLIANIPAFLGLVVMVCALPSSLARPPRLTRSAHPWLKPMISLVWELHRWVYRRSGGRVGRRLFGLPMLLLTTTGRRSGQAHTTALTYLTEGALYAVVASNGGAPQHPGWFLNLRAFPQGQIQVGSQVYRVQAREALGAERERLWNRMVQLYAGYRVYQARTARQIPVVVLEPINQPTPQKASGPTPFAGPR